MLSMVWSWYMIFFMSMEYDLFSCWSIVWCDRVRALRVISDRLGNSEHALHGGVAAHVPGRDSWEALVVSGWSREDSKVRFPGFRIRGWGFAEAEQIVRCVFWSCFAPCVWVWTQFGIPCVSGFIAIQHPLLLQICGAFVCHPRLLFLAWHLREICIIPSRLAPAIPPASSVWIPIYDMDLPASYMHCNLNPPAGYVYRYWFTFRD